MGEEAHACIDAHISDPEDRKEAHEMVDAGFDHVDRNGDGEVDEHELSKAMRDHKKAHDLAQLTQGGPTPSEIMDECDTNENGGLSKKEAFNCIKKHVPKEHH